MKRYVLALALLALASPAFAQSLPTPNLGCAFKVNGTTVGCPAAVAVGGTGGATPAAARGSAGLNVESGTGHGDSAYTILATDRWVYTNAAFTAQRTWTLPAASAVNAGALLVIDDLQATVTATNTLVVSRAGSDTINNGVTSFTIDVAGGRLILFSDGVSKWTARLQRPYGTVAGNAIFLDSSAKLPAVDGSALTNLNASSLASGTVLQGRYPATVSWTPVLNFGGASTGITVSNSQGVCQQNGKAVFCGGVVTLTNKGTAAGAATITGLPIAASTLVGDCRFTFYSGMTGMLAQNSYVFNGTTITLNFIGATSIAAMTDANFTNISSFNIACSYLTT